MIDFKLPTENIKKVVLDNGMTILVFVNKAIPKVLMQVAYEVGSSVEQAGEKGLAHLIEHMIFKGTEKLSEGDIDTIARKYGASFNAFTSKEVTSYYFEVNKNNWSPFIGILADCMKNARFESQHLSSEMRAVLQELRMRKDNFWLRIIEKIEQLQYPANHPYHYPIIGFKQDLAELTTDRLKAFYDKYYHPNKATFFVAGDVDPDEIVEHIRQNFEAIPKGEVHEDEFPTGLHELAKHHTYLYQAVQNEQVGCFWHMPGRTQIDATLVKAVAHVLAGGQASRLWRRLVDEEKIASSVAVMPYQLLHDGTLLVLFEPHNGKQRQCLEVIREEIQKIIEHGIDSDELSMMVANKQREFFSTLQAANALVYAWIESYFATRDEMALFKTMDKFEKLTSEDIQSFVRDYLDPAAMSTVVVSPLSEQMKKQWHEIQKKDEAFERKLLADNTRTLPLEEPKFALTMGEPQELEFTFPKPDRSFTLPNGLQVNLTRNEPWPLISASLYLKDADYFARARDGVVLDVVMNMLIEGSQDFSKKENVSYFERFGARFQANRAGIFLNMLNAGYQDVLNHFFHVVTRPTFAADSLEKVRSNQIDGYVRAKDDARQLGVRAMANKVYAGHPFEWTFDNAIQDLKKCSAAHLKQLHSKYISPEQMILNIVGSFDPAEMEMYVKKLFETWKGEAYVKRDYPEANFTPTPHDIQLLRDQSVLLLGRPSPLTIYDQDFTPVQMLNFITFASLGSRIYDLRERTGLFYAAGGSWAVGAGREHGADTIFTILTPDTVDEAEVKIREMLNTLGQQGVREDEMKAARQLYLKKLIDMVASNQAISIMLGSVTALELGLDYYDKQLSRVQKMDLDSLNAVCKKYFNDTDLARVRVGRL